MDSLYPGMLFIKSFVSQIELRILRRKLVGVWIGLSKLSWWLSVANITFNIAKGRVVELANRVNLNDPANAVFVICILATAGIESDATLIDVDTLAAVVAGTTNEVTNSGYARKVLDNATGGIVVTVDDTNDRTDVDFPDQTWTAVVAGDGWNDFVTNYDSDSTAGADTAIVPMTLHDFTVTPDGSDITAQIATSGFFRAS